MSLRALTLIVLMTSWMVPANGYLCPPDSTGVADHGHAQGESSRSHASDEQSHFHASQDGSLHNHNLGVAAIADSSARISGTASDELSSCCESGRDASVVEAAVKNSEIRPKSSTVALRLDIATVAPAVCLATAAQVRRRQPPPLPYEKNRRPLLI